MGFRSLSDRMKSGIMRSSDQSPPPITFPARQKRYTGVPSLEKKDRIYEDMTISAAPFEAL